MFASCLISCWQPFLAIVFNFLQVFDNFSLATNSTGETLKKASSTAQHPPKVQMQVSSSLKEEIRAQGMVHLTAYNANEPTSRFRMFFLPTLVEANSAINEHKRSHSNMLNVAFSLAPMSSKAAGDHSLLASAWHL